MDTEVGLHPAAVEAAPAVDDTSHVVAGDDSVEGLDPLPPSPRPADCLEMHQSRVHPGTVGRALVRRQGNLVYISLYLIIFQCGPLNVEIMGRPIIDSFRAWSHLSLCHKEPAKGKKAPSRGLWVP